MFNATCLLQGEGLVGVPSWMMFFSLMQRRDSGPRLAAWRYQDMLMLSVWLITIVLENIVNNQTTLWVILFGIDVLTYTGINLKHFVFFLYLIVFTNVFYYHYSKIDDFNSTDDGESCQKSHGASNCWQLVHKFCWSILGDSVKCRGIKVDPNKL